MQITLVGTGTLALALGAAWARAGHDLVIWGRSPERAAALADRIGPRARPDCTTTAVAGSDAALLAVTWPAALDALRSAGGSDGSFAGITLIDPVNAVRHGVGELLTDTSAAEEIAATAPGAHVVKAFHMFPAAQWAADADRTATVAVCGDDADSLRLVGSLVRDAGGTPAVLGPLRRARQLEEAAGFVIGLAFGGHDPSTAVPSVPGS